MHAGVARDPRLGAGVLGKIDDPQGLSRLERLAYEPGAGGIGQVARFFDEDLESGLRHVPEFAEGQHCVLLVPAEVPAALPALRLRYRANYRLQRLGCAVRFGKRAGNHVLEAQELLGARARGDVPADAAVALEALLRVEHGLPARGDVARLTLRIDTLVDESGKGPPGFEQSLVRFPASVVADGHGAAVPALGPAKLPGVESGLFEPRPPDQGKAVVLVLLPVPLRGKFEVAFEALFAQPRGIPGGGALPLLRVICPAHDLPPWYRRRR